MCILCIFPLKCWTLVKPSWIKVFLRGCVEILWLASQSPPQKVNVCFCTDLDFPAFGVHGHTVFYPKVLDLCERHHYMLTANFQTLWETSDGHLCQNVFFSGGGTQLLNTFSFQFTHLFSFPSSYDMSSVIQVKVHGSVAEGLEPVKELFQEQFNKGEELSAQVGSLSAG